MVVAYPYGDARDTRRPYKEPKVPSQWAIFFNPYHGEGIGCPDGGLR